MEGNLLYPFYEAGYFNTKTIGVKHTLMYIQKNMGEKNPKTCGHIKFIFARKQYYVMDKCLYIQNSSIKKLKNKGTISTRQITFKYESIKKRKLS